MFTISLRYGPTLNLKANYLTKSPIFASPNNSIGTFHSSSNGTQQKMADRIGFNFRFSDPDRIGSKLDPFLNVSAY
ncbi:hypothetical protein L596_026098 [Steinernema carpocapsae]|uniref:Uncharacterized protein n=1 Tax=Steinernema carpocapsae TaxID=34508 RepID=A0A4U5M1B9_STECR|nr:hypothetical protein L596_026098 [Steinernema carpocapsae]